MQPERWRRVEDLYHDALAKDVSSRSVFLAEACRGDEELRAEVESLLAQDIGDQGSLERPACDGGEEPSEPSAAMIASGAELGPYRVLGPLGAGGMGQVYRARDSRLGRSVAIKVAGRRFSGRFEREARAISALNHPHICTLYDVGPNYLVMELVEGDTLAATLRKGPLPLESVIRYGAQIADALAAAHALGIFHRDLKPANIMVGRNGVKVLDFGLAKITAPADGATPPETTLTDEQQIIGTLAYMAPEQLEGKPCNAQTDLFALGLVLYEMATGKRAFVADNQAALIARIMSSQPLPMAALPAQFAHVVERCVERDPAARWQTAADLKLELLWALQAAGPASPVTRPRKRDKVVFAMGVALLVAAVLLPLSYFRNGRQPVQAVRSSLLPPSDWSFVPGSFAVSPDGERLAFVAVGPDGINRLWVRTLSGSGAQQLNGAEGAILPFWAPDSRRIGFFAGGKLSTVDTASGAVRILWEAPAARCGGTWNRDGTIVFAPSVAGPLYRISDSGGVAAPVTRMSREGSGQSHRWPVFLPDGKRFLYYVDWSALGDPMGNGVYVGSLDGSPARLVSAELAGNVAFAAGHLIYGRDRSLRMQPFDPARLQLSGAVVSIAEQELEQDTRFSHSEFSVSQNGVMVFQSLADSASALVWFDRSGNELGLLAGARYSCPRLSPDGRFLAVSSDDARNGRYFVRVYNLANGTATRLTEVESDEDPAWSFDGKRITHGASDGQFHHLNDVAVDGTGVPRVLLKGAKMVQLDWSRDGRLVFAEFSKGPPQVMVYSSADEKVVPFAPRGSEPRFSPDGKWIAYHSVGTIFIQPFPGPGGRISSGYGAQPVWAPDGKQLFFIAADKRLMAASFNSATGSAGAPRLIFPTRIIAPDFIGTQYDVSADGRFLINTVPATASSPLTLLTGWTAQIKR